MRKYSFLLLGLLAVFVLVLAGCTAAPAPAVEEPAAEEPAASGTMTVGDPDVAAAELDCTAALADDPSDPHFATMARTYNNDMEHTGLFPCAQFTGSMTEPLPTIVRRSGSRTCLAQLPASSS